MDEVADEERRFGALRRLYGDAGYERIRAATVAVVGLGGVGSWAAEALVRSGVGAIVLIDLDHVAESNVNRQLQALTSTLGAAKAAALATRFADIHPGCRVWPVEEFVASGNWPALLPVPVDGIVDACDQVPAKAVLAAWSVAARVPLVCTGAAGGKRDAARVQIADLAETTHDPLLASLRQRLRKAGAAPRQGPIGVRCVYSGEPVQRAGAACDVDGAPGLPGLPGAPLACAGYGSSVAVTATFGMVAAGELLGALVRRRPAREAPDTCI